MSGVYILDMPIKEYHARREFTGSTGAKLAYKSMIKYNDYIATGVLKDTKDLRFGRLYHKIVGEPDGLATEFLIRDTNRRPEPDKTMQSKLNKEWGEMISNTATMRGLEICDIGEYDRAQAMRKTLSLYVRKNSAGVEFSVIDSMLKGGTVEKSYWCDDYYGLPVKCRPDLSLPYALVDFKSIADASKNGVSKAIIKFGWDIQIALYSDILTMYNEKLEEPPMYLGMPFFIIAQEKKEPYDFCVYNVSDFYELGKAKLLKAIERIKGKECRGLWGVIPPNDIALNLEAPKWALNELGFKPDTDDDEDDDEFDDDVEVEA
jgi:hypothetical protein